MPFLSIMDKIHETVEKTCRRSGWKAGKVLDDLGIARSTYYGWFGRRVKTGALRSHAIREEGKGAVLEYVNAHPELHHREMAWRMVDENVAFLSPSSVYRILDVEGLIAKWVQKENRHKKELVKPIAPNMKWQCDISYIGVGSRFFFLILFIDEHSRYIAYWELLTSMGRETVSLAAQKALEGAPPGCRPVIQTDNGSSFVSRDFKLVLSENEITHMTITPHCPEMNGVVERCYRTVKEGLGDAEFPDFYSAREVICKVVDHYNNVRLHSALSYLTPANWHFGNPEVLLNARRAKLGLARLERAEKNKRVCYEIESKLSRSGGREIVQQFHGLLFVTTNE